MLSTAVKRKKVTADFGGGLISSDGRLVLLRGAERRLGLAEALAGCIQEWRDLALVVHTLPAMERFRMFAIACGYEDDTEPLDMGILKLPLGASLRPVDAKEDQSRLWSQFRRQTSGGYRSLGPFRRGLLFLARPCSCTGGFFDLHVPQDVEIRGHRDSDHA